MKIGAIIQARMASSRLPGKILMKLPMGGEHSILDHILLRAQQVPLVNEVILATSTLADNDVLADTFQQVPVFRGSENDVLERFYEAAQAYELDHVIRLTADNPLIDPTLLQQTLEFHIESGADYTNTTGLPLGMNFEMFRMQALTASHEQAQDPAEREHVTVFMKRRPEQFKLQTKEYNLLPDARMTVDYPSDFAALHLIFSQLAGKGDSFGIEALQQLVSEHPWVLEINRQNQQVKV
ncbi:MAG TPA: spore coat protein [Cytophagales bacterium]|nr:spore coat protein [Cytophagales bacterium]HAA18394.1 spore coat protein [Cytophagales bacterium]HAP61443.1 spore coat protein [Cytophagales bacterium]